MMYHRNQHHQYGYEERHILRALYQDDPAHNTRLFQSLIGFQLDTTLIRIVTASQRLEQNFSSELR